MIKRLEEQTISSMNSHLYIYTIINGITEQCNVL